MTIVRIGEMTQRLNLEAPVRTADGGGGASVSWSLVAEVWGAIRPLSGGERFEADGLGGRLTHEIWIRHRAGVVSEMRFSLGARLFDIRAVVEAGARKRFLKCLVEERTP
jgi:SPP1 family predicted phage head-tail adaptor